MRDRACPCESVMPCHVNPVTYSRSDCGELANRIGGEKTPNEAIRVTHRILRNIRS